MLNKAGFTLIIIFGVLANLSIYLYLENLEVERIKNKGEISGISAGKIFFSSEGHDYEDIVVFGNDGTKWQCDAWVPVRYSD